MPSVWVAIGIKRDMIKDNQKYFNRLHVLLDAVVVAAAYFLSWYLKFEGPFKDEGVGAYTMEFYLSALYFVVPGYADQLSMPLVETAGFWIVPMVGSNVVAS